MPLQASAVAEGWREIPAICEQHGLQGTRGATMYLHGTGQGAKYQDDSPRPIDSG